jgi:hypothetical protein
MISAILGVSLAGSIGHTQSGLDLKIHLTQDRYVVGEPMKLVATLTNPSNEVLPIIEVRALGTNMEYMYFVVTRPDGVIQKRTTKQADIDMFFDASKYKGEPLKPGESVRVYLYPVASGVRYQSPDSDRDHNPMTFPTPGEYTLQLVYHVPKDFEQLVAATGEEVESNTLTVRIDAPTTDEAQILAACWARGKSAFVFGDNTCKGVFDPDTLQAVIDRYPKHEMVRYAKFYLAQFLMSIDTCDYEGAIEIFQNLGEEHPGFRAEERFLLMGRSLAYLGRKEQARAAFADAIRLDPLLVTDYTFMWGRWTSLDTTAGVKALKQWRANRWAGVDHPERVNIEP